MKKMTAKMKGKVYEYLTNKRNGEGYLDVLIKILITVILGAALLGLLKIAIPELFGDIVNKIKSVFII